MNIEISNTFHFEAAHKLPGLPQGHKCRGVHGHTWAVRVFVRGRIHNVTGMIIDYAELSRMWAERCHPFLDHRLLNDTMDNPTTEHIAAWIYARLEEPISSLGAELTKLEIDEGADGGSCVLDVNAREMPADDSQLSTTMSPSELVAAHRGYAVLDQFDQPHHPYPRRGR